MLALPHRPWLRAARASTALTLAAAVALSATSVPARAAGPADPRAPAATDVVRHEPASGAPGRRVLERSRLDLSALGASPGGHPLAADERIGFTILLPWGDPRGSTAPPDADAAAVGRWLHEQRLTVTRWRHAFGVVEVTGRVSDVARAFATRFRAVEIDGTELVAPAGTVSVPSRLAGVVRGVAGLVKVPMSPMSVTAPGGPAPRATLPSACARYWGERVAAQWPTQVTAARRSNRLCGYSPSDLRAVYRVPADVTGAGARIGIVGAYDDAAVGQNTDDYFTGLGLAPFADGQYVAHTSDEDDTACGDRTGWSEEQHLDVQAVHAMAPQARVVYWASPTCYSADLFATLLAAVDSGEVDSLSLSFGSREELSTGADRALLHRAVVQAAARGISVFAAAGNDGDYSDEGDHAGEVDVTSPASSPWVTAVGGLSVGMRRDGTLAAVGGWASTPYFARNGGLIPPGFAGGGGGGTSSVYRRPGWQRGVVGDAGSRRVLPDVSALADPLTGFAVRTEGETGPAVQTIGGTSLATPTVAALVSMAKAHSGRRIGLATPWLYRLLGTAALRDVTPPRAAIFSATALGAGQTWPETVVAWDQSPQSLQSAPGWDALTGVGMPSGQAFVDAFGRSPRP